MSLKPSPKLHPVGWDLLVVIAVVILAVSVGIGLLGTSESGPLTAVISADGQPEERVVLSSLTEPEERVLHSGGYTLHLVLSADGVEMTTSDCPTQEWCPYREDYPERTEHRVPAGPGDRHSGGRRTGRPVRTW